MSSAIIKCYTIRKAEEEARRYRGYHYQTEVPKFKMVRKRKLTFKKAKELGLIKSKSINVRTYWP